MANVSGLHGVVRRLWPHRVLLLALALLAATVHVFSPMSGRGWGGVRAAGALRDRSQPGRPVPLSPSPPPQPAPPAVMGAAATTSRRRTTKTERGSTAAGIVTIAGEDGMETPWEPVDVAGAGAGPGAVGGPSTTATPPVAWPAKRITMTTAAAAAVATTVAAAGTFPTPGSVLTAGSAKSPAVASSSLPREEIHGRQQTPRPTLDTAATAPPSPPLPPPSPTRTSDDHVATAAKAFATTGRRLKHPFEAYLSRSLRPRLYEPTPDHVWWGLSIGVAPRTPGDGNNGDGHNDPAVTGAAAVARDKGQSKSKDIPSALALGYRWNAQGPPLDAAVLLKYRTILAGRFRIPSDGFYALHLTAMVLASGGRAVVLLDGNRRLELPLLHGLYDGTPAAVRRTQQDESPAYLQRVEAERVEAEAVLEAAMFDGQLALLVGYVTLSAGEHTLSVQPRSQRIAKGQSGGLFQGLSMAISHCTVTPTEVDAAALARGWARPSQRRLQLQKPEQQLRSFAEVSDDDAAEVAGTATIGGDATTTSSEPPRWWPTTSSSPSTTTTNSSSSSSSLSGRYQDESTMPTMVSPSADAALGFDRQQCLKPVMASDMQWDALDRPRTDCGASLSAEMPPLARFDPVSRRITAVPGACNGSLSLVIDDPTNSEELMTVGSLGGQQDSGQAPAGVILESVDVPPELETFAVDCKRSERADAAPSRQQGFPDFFMQLQHSQEAEDRAQRLEAETSRRHRKQDDHRPAADNAAAADDDHDHDHGELAPDVIVVWVDSLSRAAFFQLLPRTAQLLSDYAIHGQEQQRRHDVAGDGDDDNGSKDDGGEDNNGGGGQKLVGPKVRAHDYRLYNALAGATQVNFPPFFCGHMPDKCPRDGRDWLSEQYRRSGYVRSFAESDMCPLGHNSLSRLLMYEMAGHARQLPRDTRSRILQFTAEEWVDHSSSNWVCAATREVGKSYFEELNLPWAASSDRLCFGGRHMFEWGMEYTTQFMRAYSGTTGGTANAAGEDGNRTAAGKGRRRRSRRFALLSTQVAHEPSQRRVAALDEALRDFIRDQFRQAAAEEERESGQTAGESGNNSGGRLLMAVVGDHGISYGKYYGTSAFARYMERHPAMFLLSSEGIHRRAPSLARHMRANQGRLITPWDMYATLNHARVYPRPSPVGSPADMGDSVLGVIAANRTCQEMGIGTSFCGCDRWASLHLPQRRSDIDTLAWLAVRRMNEITRPSRLGMRRPTGGGGGGGGTTDEAAAADGKLKQPAGRRASACPMLRMLRVLEMAINTDRSAVTLTFEVTPDDGTDTMVVGDDRGGNGGADPGSRPPPRVEVFEAIFRVRNPDKWGGKRCAEDVSCPGRPILADRVKRFESGFLWNRASEEFESLPGFIILGERFSVFTRYRASEKREEWLLVNARQQVLGLGAGEEWRRETVRVNPGTTSQRNWWTQDPAIGEGLHLVRLLRAADQQRLAERPVVLVQSLYETGGQLRRRRASKQGLDAASAYYEVASMRRLSLFERDKGCSHSDHTAFCLCDGA